MRGRMKGLARVAGKWERLQKDDRSKHGRQRAATQGVNASKYFGRHEWDLLPGDFTAFLEASSPSGHFGSTCN